MILTIICYRQKLTLVAEKLAQVSIIDSKNSNILIEIKASSLFFFPFWKKETAKIILGFFISPVSYVTSRTGHSFSSYFSESTVVSQKFSSNA